MHAAQAIERISHNDASGNRRAAFIRLRSCFREAELACFVAGFEMAGRLCPSSQSRLPPLKRRPKCRLGSATREKGSRRSAVCHTLQELLPRVSTGGETTSR